MKIISILLSSVNTNTYQATFLIYNIQFSFAELKKTSLDYNHLYRLKL